MAKMKKCEDCGNSMLARASICRICDDRKYVQEQHLVNKELSLFKGNRICTCVEPAINFDGTCLNCGLLLSARAFNSSAVVPVGMKINLNPNTEIAIRETQPQDQIVDFIPEGVLQTKVNMSALYVGGIGTHLSEKIKGTLFVSSAGFEFTSKKQHWKKDLDGLKTIQIGGAGAFQTGGGFFGGGFGLKGALEGIAIAKILNTVTTRTKFDCLLRVVYPDIEIYLQILDRTPRQLTIDLTGISHYLENKKELSGNDMKQELNISENQNIDRLLKLADLLEKGLISREEFESQKEKLISN
jgi:hypothetical protein